MVSQPAWGSRISGILCVIGLLAAVAAAVVGGAIAQGALEEG
jgi:hypothetical protein